MQLITPNLARLKTTIANIYLVGAPGSPWVLVDAGTPGKSAFIRAAAEQRFGANARPAAILLTHGHFDHVGSALELAEIWDVPVYAHRLERPFLSGKSPYAPKDPTVGGAMGFLSRFFPSHTADLGDRLRDLPDGEVPGLPDWRWHHTPGHSPGHVVFFHEADGILLAGDACVTMDLDSFGGMIFQAPRISRPPSPFTCDWNQAQQSVEFLAGLRPAVLATGHGEPMAGTMVAAELAAFARAFEPPAHGRYVKQPACADETGITLLPPPQPDAFPKIAAGIGASVGALAALVAITRRNARR